MGLLRRVNGLCVNMELYTARRQTKKHVEAKISVFWEILGWLSLFYYRCYTELDFPADSPSLACMSLSHPPLLYPPSCKLVYPVTCFTRTSQFHFRSAAWVGLEKPASFLKRSSHQRISLLSCSKPSPFKKSSLTLWLSFLPRTFCISVLYCALTVKLPALNHCL